jgi:pyridoxamine 5'-phosphate oxidase
VISDLRREYASRSLGEADTHPNPLQQFRAWFDEALQSQVMDPNAMSLSTASPTGDPSVRMVLLKELDASGFVFFTQYDSPKGRDLALNPRAALLFYWAELERQVRIVGQVTAERMEFWQGRPGRLHDRLLYTRQADGSWTRVRLAP